MTGCGIAFGAQNTQATMSGALSQHDNQVVQVYLDFMCPNL